MGMKPLTCALVLGLAAAHAASAQTRREIRFAEMDTNNDRVVTRKEWRGSDQSFQVHDWNRDGILSGDEVRQGGRRSDTQNTPGAFESADQEYPYTDWTARGVSTRVAVIPGSRTSTMEAPRLGAGWHTLATPGRRRQVPPLRRDRGHTGNVGSAT